MAEKLAERIVVRKLVVKSKNRTDYAAILMILWAIAMSPISI